MARRKKKGLGPRSSSKILDELRGIWYKLRARAKNLRLPTNKWTTYRFVAGTTREAASGLVARQTFSYPWPLAGIELEPGDQRVAELYTVIRQPSTAIADVSGFRRAGHGADSLAERR